MNRMFLKGCVFLFLTLVSRLAYAQEIEKKPELEAYLANRDKFEEYACAMFVEHVSDHPDPDKCIFRDDWYIHCVNVKEKNQRFEQLPMFHSKYPGVTIRGSQLLISNGKTRSSGHGAYKLPEFVDSSDVKENDENKVESCNPFQIPFFNTSAFAPRSLYYLRSDGLKPVFTRFQKTDEEEIPYGLFAKYKVTPQADVFSEVLFDDRNGGMPIRIITKDPPRNAKRMDINWFETEKGWLPVKANFKMTFGDPLKPARTDHFEVTYYWMLNLPKKVWESNYRGKEGLTPKALRDLITANAIQTK